MIMNEVCSLEFPVVIRQNGSLLINSIYYFLIHARMKNSKREAMESAEIVKTYLNNYHFQNSTWGSWKREIIYNTRNHVRTKNKLQSPHYKFKLTEV
jgi:hypothetical protein